MGRPWAPPAAVLSWLLLRSGAGRPGVVATPLSSIGATASAVYRAGILQALGLEEEDLAGMVADAAAMHRMRPRRPIS